MHNDAPDALSKTSVRVSALARRAGLSTEARGAAARLAVTRLDASVLQSARVIAGYAPIRDEFDPQPLMQLLASRGMSLALPAIVGRDQPLVFRRWSREAPLAPGPFEIPQPRDDAATVIPDVVLVPLAAFDRKGHRIGYGGGFYDRTLPALRAQHAITAIGVGFAVQEVPYIPSAGHDARLDFVLTEREWIDVREN